MDVESLRRETPGCDALIHFDNAGAALMPEPVRRAVLGPSRPRGPGRRLPRREAGGRGARRLLRRLRPTAQLRAGGDRLRGERDPCLGHGLLRHSLRAGRPDPDQSSRVRQQLSGLPADCAAPRRGDRRRARRRERTGLPCGARGLDRPAHAARCADPCPDPGRPRQSGGGGRRDRPASWSSLSARRLSIRRSDGPGRRGPRLRHPVRHRPQVPARPARHRLSLCPPRPPGGSRAALRRPPCRDLDRARQFRDPRRRAALRELGELRRRPPRARGRGRTTPWHSASRRSRRGSRRLPRPCGNGCGRSPG